MRVLVCCEESQVVTAAFRLLGHDAFSCGFSRSGGAARVRSRTFPGIAAAMAAQWSSLPL